MKKSVWKVTAVIFSLCLMLFTVAGCSDSAANENEDQKDSKESTAQTRTVGAKVGQILPETTFNKMNSEEKVTLPIKGKLTVINLWATWCPPCQEEMPEIQKFYENNKDNENIAFYSINLAEAPEEIEEFFEDFKLSFPVLVDYDDKSILMLSTNGIPTTVIVGEDGVVKFRRVGPVTLKELESAVLRAKK